MLYKLRPESIIYKKTHFYFSDATSTGDAVALQNRLQNLNTGLETGLQDLSQYNGLPASGPHRFIGGQQNNYQNGNYFLLNLQFSSTFKQIFRQCKTPNKISKGTFPNQKWSTMS